MSSTCRTNITDRSNTWKNPNDSTRIFNVGEVRVVLAKEFNGHELFASILVQMTTSVRSSVGGWRSAIIWRLSVGSVADAIVANNRQYAI